MEICRLQGVLKLVSFINPFCRAGCSTCEREAPYRAVEKKKRKMNGKKKKKEKSKERRRKGREIKNMERE
jgi:MinD superfamily P-loop ATPase